jgi:biotin carboxylase
VRAAGLRTPKSQRATSKSEVWAAREEIGYPMIIKPIAGAGSADTYRVDSDVELEKVLALTAHVVEVSCEEYIEGDEFTYDTICVGGRPIYENCTQYLPKPLEARSHEWISPVVITIKDMQQPFVRKGVELGRNVLRALGMGDGFTHMEWFFTKKGEAVFGEIGCRPGGAHIVDQMNYTSDVDLFREWARVVCWHSFEADATRKYNAGIIFKRAKGHGRISQIVGLQAWKQRWGNWIVEDKLLRPGTPRRDWKQTLLSDGHLMCRHPDWDTAKEMCFEAARNITLYAE